MFYLQKIKLEKMLLVNVRIETCCQGNIAGTKKVGDDWFTNGGRVLAIVAGGETREEAVVKAHDEAAKVTFDGSQRRNDIGRLHF
mgnify:CR=1 FL=1